MNGQFRPRSCSATPPSDLKLSPISAWPCPNWSLSAEYSLLGFLLTILCLIHWMSPLSIISQWCRLIPYLALCKWSNLFHHDQPREGCIDHAPMPEELLQKSQGFPRMLSFLTTPDCRKGRLGTWFVRSYEWIWNPPIQAQDWSLSSMRLTRTGQLEPPHFSLIIKYMAWSCMEYNSYSVTSGSVLYRLSWN